MRYLILLCTICMLTGCFVYSAKDDCIYGLTSTQCFGDLYPTVAHYQKPFSLGKTNSQKRRKDMEECGAIFHKNQINYSIKGIRDKNGLLILSVGEDFENCMEQKGYIYLSHDECGRKNSRSDKGVCNE